MNIKRFVLGLTLLTLLSACGVTSPNSEVAGLYTGYEQGSWYKFSGNCSAKLCPAY